MRSDRDLQGQGRDDLRNTITRIVKGTLKDFFEPFRAIGRFFTAKSYAAVLLCPSSQRELLAWWEETVGIPLLGDVKAHHMTLIFDPTASERALVRTMGVTGYMQVVGYAADEKGQAVLVHPEGSLWSKNLHPHVTVAVAPDVPAVYSNELLARGHTQVKGPRLVGVVEILAD